MSVTHISGGATAQALAAGQHADILNGLARQTAAVTTGSADVAGMPAVAANF
jgi:hypothetical protein